jgi:uncharacterized Zn finger protein
MGWGYYDNYYPPYVPVAERRANAAKEVAKLVKKGQKITPVKIEGRKITNSFWGNSWCNNLEAYSDYENRLPRGRTYVRNGSVVHLEIGKGQITAMVSGSELYRVKITISELLGQQWKDVKKECAGQIGSLVELLQGKLSKEVMEIVTRKGSGLFPKPREIKMSCSCPDSAGMCKHLAAVMYGVGARLDYQPELLFTLRQVDHLELIEGAGKVDLVGKPKKGGKKTIDTGDLAGMFGIEMAGSADVAPTRPVAETAAARKSSGKSKASPPVSVIVAKPQVKSSAKKSAKPATIAVPAAKAIVTDVVVTGKPKRKGAGQLTGKAEVAVKPVSKSKATVKKSPAASEEKPRIPRKTKSAPSVKSLARTNK